MQSKLEEFIVFHILDNLSNIYILDIFKKYIENGELFKDDEQADDESKIKESLQFNDYVRHYFDAHKISETDYIFKNYKDSKNNFSVYRVIPEEKTFTQIKVNTGVLRNIKNKFPLYEIDVNDDFGYMGKLSKSFVFKIKNLKSKEKNNTGKMCRGNKKDIAAILKKIYKYHDEEAVIYQNDEDLKKTKTNAEKICREIELLLRYFDSIRKNDKRWFFSSTEDALYDLKKFPKKTAKSKKFIN